MRAQRLPRNECLEESSKAKNAIENAKDRVQYKIHLKKYHSSD